ncbi:putative Deoxyribodipyrimidine photo-lyase [Tirmania nivea]|nr:putative Deoxyribodipyrimidine photo-lyase [Tirmania nivea]
MPSTRSSSKRKLTDFLTLSTPLTTNPRRPKLVAGNPVASTLIPKSNAHVKAEHKSHYNVPAASESPHNPEAAPLKAENIKSEHNRTSMDPKLQSGGIPRYHQPKLPPEEDEIVMRKYYPAEMSNERVEMYKSGQLPRPIYQLEQALSRTSTARSQIPVKNAVVHWFRGDLRVSDNTALHMASEKAKSKGVNLIALFLVSPQDFEAHIKSPARVDFILRTLEVLREDLDNLHIPLWVEVVENRKNTGKRVMELMEEWNASHIFGNMEYEVDELRRDARIVDMALEKNIDFTVVHDSVIVPPSALQSTRKPFTVFTPWFKAWVAYLHENPKHMDVFPAPTPNPRETRTYYKNLFDCPIPPCPEGRLDSMEVEYLRSMWPPGEKEALARLQKFLDEKIMAYKDQRNFLGGNATSVLSVHFAAGTLSTRTAMNKARELLGNGTLNTGNKGITCWISEVGWREFYRGILVNFPWVWYVPPRLLIGALDIYAKNSMAKPFKVKYSNIPWQYNDAHFEAWCKGRTGYPIVDAAMRQLTTMKYMHNRARMIVASFLVKDLCLDWRKGEKFFMEHLIDGDFASNNGGWGWSSSSGCNPQPFFRIFNPLLQSEKFDPEGDYIRTWVPELKYVEGKAIHAPFERLDREGWAKIEALGYPKPIVKHLEAKKRALELYKKGLGREKP